MGRWKQITGRHEAPFDPGVYAFFRDGELLYIGSTSCLRKRFYSHELDPRLKGATIKVRTCSRYAEWLMVERRLIERLCPAFNARPPRLHRNARWVGTRPAR